MIFRILMIILLLPFELRAAQPIDNFFGDWCISSTERYRGGLTTESDAESKIGSKLTLSSELYRSFHRKIEFPILKLNSEKIEYTEGVVPEKNSLFYGVFPNRDKLDVIRVFEASDLENPWTELEIISKESLFELYDGFVYVYKKCT